VASTAVIQTKQGIGDVIWHLPFIRAIAARSPGGRVTFLTLPSSQAKPLLAAEPAVDEVVYFEHNGSQAARLVHQLTLARLLRRRRFETVWILDRTTRPAVSAFLAGIPNRYGLGLGRQSWLITNGGIDRRYFHAHPIGWLQALMEAMDVPLADTEPRLQLPPEIVTAIAARFRAAPRPWIVFGLGASHPDKEWSEAHMAAFVAAIGARSAGTLFAIGGPANAARAQRLMASIACADAYVGPDSGPMNIAAAVGTPAFGLYGLTPVIAYSRHLHPIRSPRTDGSAAEAMQAIDPRAVADTVAQFLAARAPRIAVDV
jgi:heptosyltransferase-2